MKKILPILSASLLISLSGHADETSTETVPTVDLPSGYNIWSTVSGLGSEVTTANINFNSGGGGLCIDFDERTIKTATIAANGNYFQVKTGYTATVDAIALATGVSSAIISFGTGNATNKPGYSGTLNIKSGSEKIGITNNCGTVNMLNAGALGGKTYTVNEYGTINFRNADNTTYSTFNNGAIVANNGGVLSAGLTVATTVIINNGGTVNAYAAMRILSSGTINGALIVNGGNAGTSVTGDDGLTYNTRNFVLRFGNGTNNNADTDAKKVYTIGTTATILQYNGTAGYTNDFLGDVRVSAATGALKFENALNLAGKGKLTLNSSNAFAKVNSSGGVIGEQKDMELLISRKYYDAGTLSQDKYVSDTTLVINADNSFKALSFGSDTKLTLDIASGKVLTLGGITTQSGSNGVYTLILKDFDDNSLRITDMSDDAINALKFYELGDGGSLSELDFVAVKATDSIGGYWVNSAVPEPAEWATIFGAIALGFVVYRRRK